MLRVGLKRNAIILRKWSLIIYFKVRMLKSYCKEESFGET